MIRAAVLVPAPDYGEDWAWTYDVESAALERGGFAVESRPWNAADDLSEFDVILPLVAWGYQSEPEAWFALLDRLERDGSNVVNPVPVLRWNSHKSYLEELGARGIPTVPTRRIETLDQQALDAARRDFGPELVIKPPISASAYGTFRLGADDPLPDEARGREMMVQPFLRSVMEEGEYSLLYFDGAFSHSIVKIPQSGDYRTQPHLGGSEVPCDPPSGSRQVAETALAAAPQPPAYARVDLIRLDDGTLAVIELELIEPSFWLQYAPDGGSSFVAAIAKRAQQ